VTLTCAWCGKPFNPRTTGGKLQRFCCSRCRRALDGAGRRYIAGALANGMLTIDALRNGPAATRALVVAAISPPPLDRTREALSDISGAGEAIAACTLRPGLHLVHAGILASKVAS
jgi:hypothetical protein